MSRKDELLKLIDNNVLLLPLVDKIINLENKLNDVEKLPFYKVNPNNREQQKLLPAFRIYKELLQQYTNCIKTLAQSINADESDEESPLRAWARKRAEDNVN